MDRVRPRWSARWRASAHAAWLVIAVVAGPAYAVPANDDCTTATVIDTLPFHDTVDVSTATFSAEEQTALAGYSGFGHAVWYRLPIGVADPLVFDVRATNFSGRLWLLNGECAQFSGPSSPLGQPQRPEPIVTLGGVGTKRFHPPEYFSTFHRSPTYYLLVVRNDSRSDLPTHGGGFRLDIGADVAPQCATPDPFASLLCASNELSDAVLSPDAYFGFTCSFRQSGERALDLSERIGFVSIDAFYSRAALRLRSLGRIRRMLQKIASITSRTNARPSSMDCERFILETVARTEATIDAIVDDGTPAPGDPFFVDPFGNYCKQQGLVVVCNRPSQVGCSGTGRRKGRRRRCLRSGVG